MSDWAEECAERWLATVYGNTEPMRNTAEAHMVEGAVREALAKAADTTMEAACDCLAADGWTAEDSRHERWCCGLGARDAIRALGAAK